MKKLISGLLLSSFLAIVSIAQAQDITLRVEPGVGFPLGKPQTDRFNVGGDLMVKAAVSLHPWVDLNPGVGVLVLPSSSSFRDTGTAWMFGGGLRLKRPHDESNKGTGLKAFSPWVDADLQYVRTGILDRLGWNVGTGVAVPTSDDRDLWVGPFARYQSIFEDTKVGFDTTDAKMFILGVSLEIGSKKKSAQQTQVVVKKVNVCPDKDHDGISDSVDKCPEIPGPIDNFGCPRVEKPPVIPVSVKTELKKVIQFSWNSNKLDLNAKKSLDEVTKILSDKKYDDIVVEGHASSEGQIEFNNVLANKRAQAVLDYLVSKGIDKNHLSAKGFGSNKPIDSNKSFAGRIHNRRAEFVVSFTVKESK